MKRMISIFTLVILLSGCVATFHPIKHNPIGKTYQDSIKFRNLELPLPKGVWVVTGRGFILDDKYAEIVLLNLQTMDIVYIERNSLENSYLYYHPSKYLERNDIHSSVVKNNLGTDQDGWLINHYRPSLSSKISEATKETYKYIKNKGYTVPGNYVSVPVPWTQVWLMQPDDFLANHGEV